MNAPFYKNKKFWIIIAVVVVITIIVIVLAKRKKMKALEPIKNSDSTTKNPSTTSTTSTVSIAPAKFPLVLNSNGKEVIELQKYLNYYMLAKYPNSAKIKENGYFGTDTAYALKQLWNATTVTEADYNRSIKPFIYNTK